MTSKELRTKKSDLFKRVTHRLGGDEAENTWNKHWENPARYKRNWSDEEKREDEILDCIEMIHSIIAYAPMPTVERVLSDSYLEPYISSLGYDDVAALVSQEMKHFDSIGRKRTTSYTNDGAYSGIDWGDE